MGNNQRDMSVIKEELIKKRNEILSRVNKIQYDKTKRDGPLDKDAEDQSILVQNDEVIDRLDELERNELKLIEEAIIRLDTNQYGICKICDGPISEKRLKAIPYTTSCLECA